jgi:hypothetical protein
MMVHNKLLALFSNLLIGVTHAMLFKRYQLEHHNSLGKDGINNNFPMKLELVFLKNVLAKPSLRRLLTHIPHHSTAALLKSSSTPSDLALSVGKKSPVGLLQTLPSSQDLTTYWMTSRRGL